MGASRRSATRRPGAPPRAAPADHDDVVRSAGAAFVAGAAFPPAFYDRDPRLVARALLGAVLECRTADGLVAGRVVETEAYLGAEDPGCHAVVGRTRRTWHLFGPPGRAYVYRIYGMYWCFNAVTLPEGVGSAALVRAVEPLDGVALMRRRRPRAASDRELTNGPSKLCAAFGIDGALDGVSLQAPPLVLRAAPPVDDADVVVTPRIGLTRGAELPYRYFVRESPYVSRTPARFPRAAYRG
jgi:DNA-3-methyladenine glycosylase